MKLIFLFLLISCGVHEYKKNKSDFVKVDSPRLLVPMPKKFDIKSKSVYKRISCNNCHEKLELTHVHEAAKASCLNCHYPHNKKDNQKHLLRKPRLELCTQCHKQKNIHNNNLMIKNHPINDKIKCIDCHDPHGSLKGKEMIRFNYDLKSPYKGNMCAKCHWSKSHDSQPPN